MIDLFNRANSEIQTCRLGGELLIKEWQYGDSISLQCGKQVRYLGELTGEYSIVQYRTSSLDGVYKLETIEYYYSRVCEVVVNQFTTTIYFNINKFIINKNEIMCIDEIKNYLKRSERLGTFM